MRQAVMDHLEPATMVIKAAAVADASPDIPDLRAAKLIGQACALPIRWPWARTS